MLGGPGWRKAWTRDLGPGGGAIRVLNGRAIGGGVHDPVGTFSIKCVPRGRAVYRAGGASHVLSGARAVILNAGQPYELEFPATFGTQTLCVFFSDDLLRLAMAAPGDNAPSAALPEFPDVVFRPGTQIASELERLHASFAADDPTALAGEERLLSLLQAVVAAARGHAGAAARTGAVKAATRRLLLARLERAREMLDDAGDVPLGVLARESALSKFHLLRLFRAVHGTTPAGYAAARRMERAKALLRGTALSAAAVAEAVGYRSDSAFLRAFRRHTGATPAMFRAG
ncbi:MAG: AraC family transcriptional regulator [Rhizomicrobium sp.]